MNVIEGKTILFAQKVNDKYPYGDGAGYSDILLDTPSPSDLDSDDALDYYEITDMDDTSEALQVEKTFVFTDTYPLAYAVEPLKAIAQIGIAKGTQNSYCTKVTYNIGIIDAAGDFTSKATVDATPNVYTDSTTYQFLDASAFFPADSTFVVEQANRLALKTRVYGRVGAAGNGKIKLCISRGSGDTYVIWYKR